MVTASRPGSNFAAWDAARAISRPWIENTAIGTVQRLHAGELLYAQGDLHACFYLVRSGFVHTTVLHPTGHQLLLEVFGPGAIFGEASAFIAAHRHVSATAVTPVVLSRYEAQEIRELMGHSPDLVMTLLQLLGHKHRLLIDKLSSFTSTTPSVRLMELLARAELLPHDSRTGKLHLTHEQIGAMTGLSRVTVTRVLRSMVEKNWVATHKGSIEILDPHALREALARQ